jgi:thiol-disulfide isomerase/thioredoxin
VQLEPKRIHAPEIGQHWINSPPLSIHGLRGKVILIDFWDFTCVNCIRTLPYVREWHQRYRDKGLVVIGIHAPEFGFARTAENVAQGIAEFQIEYPVLLDSDYQAWRAFANRYWPAKYLIDPEGYIRYFHAGEGAYHETESAIQALLREADPAVELPPLMDAVRAMDDPGTLQVCERPTPELYLGHQRGHVANASGFAVDRIADYHFGDAPAKDAPELSGQWMSAAQFAEVAGDAQLRLHYSAAEVNLVMACECPAGRLDIRDDGKPVDHQSRGADVREDPDGTTYVEITRPKMYSLIQRDRFLSRVLDLSSASRGLQLYAFTFVSCVPRT